MVGYDYIGLVVSKFIFSHSVRNFTSFSVVVEHMPLVVFLLKRIASHRYFLLTRCQTAQTSDLHVFISEQRLDNTNIKTNRWITSEHVVVTQPSFPMNRAHVRGTVFIFRTFLDPCSGKYRFFSDLLINFWTD